MKAIVFTDGACSGNPGPGGWGTIISLVDDETVELGGPELATTNNRMEMRATLEALSWMVASGKDIREVLLYADSKYMIEGLTRWIHGWIKNGWINGGGEPVKNKDLWIELKRAKDELESKGCRLSFHYVAGHSGVPGNERCDEIAQGFSSGLVPSLFRGPTSSYSVSLVVPSSEDRGKLAKPYYLSLIAGEVFRDETWPACQNRVQGRSGARYKKISSKAEELETIKKWGVRPKPDGSGS